MIYEKLSNLNIEYEEISHQPVYTIVEASKLKEQISGVGSKTLFLTNHKNKFYLYLLEDTKRASLKELEKFLNERHLSFASEEELKKVLGLEKGGVTPLGIINDNEGLTEVIIAKDLVDKKILCHPNTNTKTISIRCQDIIKLIEFENHKYYIY